MDGARFAKLCRECRLIGKGFTSTRADLVFASIKQTVSDDSRRRWLACA
jgi:hypothetical protein